MNTKPVIAAIRKMTDEELIELAGIVNQERIRRASGSNATGPPLADET